MRTPGVGLNLVDQIAHAARQAGHNAGEDQQAHAVADAAVGNLLAQPHDERGAGGQGENRHQDEPDARVQHQPLLGKNGGDADGLERAQDHGHVTRPLGDLAPAQLAFLLNAGQGLIDHGEQLEDDRRRDIGHDAEGEDGHAAQVAATEQVHEAQRRAGLRVEQQLQLVGVDAWCGDERSQPVDGENAHGEHDPLAQVWNPKDIEELFQHMYDVRFRRPAAPGKFLALILAGLRRGFGLPLILRYLSVLHQTTESGSGCLCRPSQLKQPTSFQLPAFSPPGRTRAQAR